MPRIVKLPVTNGSTVYVHPNQVAWFRPAQADSELRLVGEFQPLWIKLTAEALAAQLNEAMRG